MAASSTMSKSRQPNFTAQELGILTEMVQEHIGILSSKFTSAITNQKKELVWMKITEAVNACGIHKRTTEKVKEKWRQLKANAKRQKSSDRKEMVKTGGGPAIKTSSDGVTRAIQDLYQQDPSWIGLEGVESGYVFTTTASLPSAALGAEPAETSTTSTSTPFIMPEGANCMVEQMHQTQDTILGKTINIYSLIHKL